MLVQAQSVNHFFEFDELNLIQLLRRILPNKNDTLFEWESQTVYLLLNR